MASRLISSKIVVGLVKYVIGAGFILNVIHGVHVVHLGFRNQQERGNLSLDIEKCMDLDAALCRAELRPLEKFQTEVCF